MALTIGALAKRAGLTVRTLHHYDAIGLLRPSGRSGAGYRLYEQADVMRLHAILALRGFGCSLAAIREALAGDGIPLPDILDRQMEVLDAQIRQGQVLRERLAWLRERMGRNEGPGLGEWLSALEMMHMYEQYFTSDELAVLGLVHRREDGRRLDREWRELAGAIRGAMACGESPDGELGQSLARRWLGLVRETTAVFSTALSVAWLRAAHQVLDNPPIIADPFAFTLLTAEEQAYIRDNLDQFDGPPLRGVRTSLAGRARLMARTETGGEPWKSTFDPATLAASLRAMGYARVEDLDGATLSARYLAGRTDALRKSNVTRLCIATM